MLRVLTFGVPTIGDPSGFPWIDDSLWIAYPRDSTSTVGAFYINHPSPTTMARVHRSWTGDIFFDPPARLVGFFYCVDGLEHYVYAYDASRRILDWEYIPPEGGSRPCGTWQSIQLQATSDAIAQLRIVGLRGLPVIDDLKITRAAQPEIVCDTVKRGQPTTCRINEAVEAVSGWQWKGQVFGPGTHTIPNSSTSTSWPGTAVQSGSVSAFVSIDGIPDTLTGALNVLDRSGPDWEWGESDWHFAVDSISSVLCSYPPFEFPPDSVRLATNRRASTCLDQEQGSIEPNILTDTRAGYDIVQVQDNGPNHGLWYVVDARYFMDRVAERNPYLERPPTGPSRTLTHPDDLNACRQGKAAKELGIGKSDPVVVNFFQYNSICRSFALTGMYEAIWDHEGLGTQGTGVPNANGHESRRQYIAGQPGHDPRKEAESKVTTTEAILRSNVQNSVWSIEEKISSYAADHSAVRDNYIEIQGNTTNCGKAWVYHKDPNNKYIQIELKQELSNGAKVCI